MKVDLTEDSLNTFTYTHNCWHSFDCDFSTVRVPRIMSVNVVQILGLSVSLILMVHELAQLN